MNTRERVLAVAVLAVVCLAGTVVMAYQFVVTPIDERKASLRGLQADIDTKSERIAQVQMQKPKLELWRQLSLPADVDMARREYERELNTLMKRSRFANGSFTVTPKPPDTKTSPTIGMKKEPIYTRLAYTVQAHTSLANLVDFLERFYRSGLLQQIKSISITRPVTASGPQQRSNILDINMNIEALVVAGAEKRPTLYPRIDRRLLALDLGVAIRGGPTGLALVPWAIGPAGPLGSTRLALPDREYAAIAGKNIFFGPPPPRERTNAVDVTEFVHLTDITRNERKTEAFLYDRYNNRTTRLRASAGFNAFRVLDNDGEVLVQGTVVQVEEREVVFKVGEKYYTIHVGQSLQEVLEKPLKDQQLKDMGINIKAGDEQ